MTHRPAFAVLILVVGFLLSVSLAVARKPATQTMSKEQAIAAVRSTENREAGSKPANPGYVVLHRIEPDANARKVGEEILAEVRSKRLEVYDNAFSAKFLSAGGYIILEFDRRTGMASGIFGVTTDKTGKAFALEMSPIEAGIRREDAVGLVKKEEELSREYFTSPSSQMGSLWRKYGNANTRGCMDLDAEAPKQLIPERLRKLAASPQELDDILDLSCGSFLWLARYPMTLLNYVEDPVDSQHEASDELTKMGKEFPGTRGKPLFPGDEVADLNSIAGRKDLLARIGQVRRFNSFLDRRWSSSTDSGTYKANLLLLTIPRGVFFGHSPSLAGRTCYVVGNSTGLISSWLRERNGTLVLLGLTLWSQ